MMIPLLFAGALLVSASDSLLKPTPFAPGAVSTDASETSPSFTADGRTMVFARYSDDWTQKQAFIAYRTETTWRVEPLADTGPVYNLAIAPDGQEIVYVVAEERVRTVFRLHRTDTGWSTPENLTARYGLVGAYPCLTAEGDLLLYQFAGTEGAGIYRAPREGDGFGPAEALYLLPQGTAFDAFAATTPSSLLVTRCVDDTCTPGPENGVFVVDPDPAAPLVPRAVRRLDRLPYVWGLQPVPTLSLLVFTDGEDILMVPLAESGL
ncbi:MAG: hypothetical protein AAF970_11685 [Bacteroidota bacterium]